MHDSLPGIQSQIHSLLQVMFIISQVVISLIDRQRLLEVIMLMQAISNHIAKLILYEM